MAISISAEEGILEPLSLELIQVPDQTFDFGMSGPLYLVTSGCKEQSRHWQYVLDAETSMG
jgi:hypothetical protein